MHQNDTPNPKYKIISAFSLVLILLSIASVIAYKSVDAILDSMNTLSKPDHKLSSLNRLLTNISEAESNIRTYTITHDQYYLDNYSVLINQARAQLDTLKFHINMNPLHEQKLDSIGILLHEKVESFNELITFKSNTQGTFSTKAINKITQRSLDSVRKKQLFTTTTTKKTQRHPTLPKVEIKKESQNRGESLLSNLLGLFNKTRDSSNINFIAQEGQTFVSTEVKVDTAVVMSREPDSLLFDIRKILNEIQREESRYQSKLSDYELNLLLKDQLIMEKIRLMIASLEEEQLRASIYNASNARSIISESAQKIFIIGTVGIGCCLFLLLLILRDITKSNFYRLELLEAKGRAEKLAQAKEEFLSNMSHEIRTPLNGIIGFVNQLKKTQLSQQQSQFLKAVDSSSIHLLSTVNDILDLSKIEAGKVSLEHITFEPVAVINDVTDSLSIQADEKGISLSSNIPQQAHPVTGDPFRLKQILYNLVSNAIKFTPKGSVKVIYEEEILDTGETLATIKVADTGIGISTDKLEAIFDSFSQADNSTSRQFGGTGLGLSITKRLVHLLGGEIRVESTPGQGSTFVVRLKYSNEQPVLETDSKEQDPLLSETNLSGLNLLLVDDDPINMTLLQTMLDQRSVSYRSANTATKALNILKSDSQKFDGILTDIQMPGMSGLELAQKIRLEFGFSMETLPIIALTANAIQNSKDYYISKGINDFIVKPFTEKRLLEVLITLQKKPVDLKQPKNTIITSVATSGDAMYSLEDLNRFSGNDDAALHKILSMIIGELSKNMATMEEAANDNNLKLVQDMAHKMYPSFAHLKAIQHSQKAKTIENDLTSIEDLSALNEIEYFREITIELIKNLEIELAELTTA